MEMQTHSSPAHTSLPKKTELQKYYEEFGYVLLPKLFSGSQIDSLLSRYRRDIVPSTHPFFRQNANRYETNDINEHGYVRQSFLDIHDYKKFPEFSTLAKELFFSPEILKALHNVTGFTQFNLMQTMLFDANTETTPHQDWWYLDSIPSGNLLGAWIALEDIHEEAGRFFVMPKTHSVDLHSDTVDLPHSQWLERMRDYMKAHPENIAAPSLKKGDVIFWNSRTIHGALKTLDPKYSRKSVTAHYLPAHMHFGNLFITKDFIKYKSFRGHKYFRNQPDYSLFNKLKYGMKVWLYDSPQAVKFFRRFQKKKLIS